MFYHMWFTARGALGGLARGRAPARALLHNNDNSHNDHNNDNNNHDNDDNNNDLIMIMLL